ncbi:MAG: Tol biopolymer transport system component, partial [Candidatus Aldehydirespiratoraceae bacterium]
MNTLRRVRPLSALIRSGSSPVFAVTLLVATLFAASLTAVVTEVAGGDAASAAVTDCDGLLWEGTGPDTTDIWTANDTGANRDNITDLIQPAPTTSESSQWSPDGTRIAWEGDDGTTFQIWVADADGSNRQKISDVGTGTDPTNNFDPQWSPDGTKIAWEGDDGTTEQIWVADADGSNRQKISDVGTGT